MQAMTNSAALAPALGRPGKGIRCCFAVVASEIRSLAGRSADAAKEIKSLINDSVERVAQGTALVEQMATAASSLKSQAQDLVGAVAVFKLAQGQSASASYRGAPALLQ